MCNSADQTTAAKRQLLALKAVCSNTDILPEYLDTPVADLLTMHDLDGVAELDASTSMVIVTCMDARLVLKIPKEGAFVIRTAGAAPQPALSNIAFAVAAAGVRTICIIGHTDCAMARTDVARQPFLQHMIEAEGWSDNASEAMFSDLQQIFAIHDPVVATSERAQWLRQQFPTCLVAPLLYQVEDHMLTQITTNDRAAT